MARSNRASLDGIATDGLAHISSRNSMQADRRYRPNEGLMQAYDEENDIGLDDMTSDDDNVEGDSVQPNKSNAPPLLRNGGRHTNGR